jgi:hypothetical protein
VFIFYLGLPNSFGVECAVWATELDSIGWLCCVSSIRGPAPPRGLLRRQRESFASRRFQSGDPFWASNRRGESVAEPSPFSFRTRPNRTANPMQTWNKTRANPIRLDGTSSGPIRWNREREALGFSCPNLICSIFSQNKSANLYIIFFFFHKCKSVQSPSLYVLFFPNLSMYLAQQS